MKEKITDITLKSVTKADCRFLFEILKERDPKANISHRKMPTYEEHVKFVMSKPYSKWYVIKSEKDNIGSVYLTINNEVGIFIKKDFQKKGIGKKALKAAMDLNPRSRYLANVSPRNLGSIRFFKDNGFILVQYTYELIKD
jgi:RimJ/RimL family protein N-acetyltransferase